MAKQFVIARHQEGITINQYEFLQDENNVEFCFDTAQQACDHLNTATGLIKTIEQWDAQGIYFIERDLYKVV